MITRFRLVVAFLVVVTVSIVGVSPAIAQGNGEEASTPPNFGPVIYADGELYGTNVNGPLPAPNGKNRHAFDDLYVTTNGVGGQLPVAEAAPGPGYNGGRWAVVELTWVDGSDPVELTRSAQIDMYLGSGLLTANEAGVYFSCPLLPVK